MTEIFRFAKTSQLPSLNSKYFGTIMVHQIGSLLNPFFSRESIFPAGFAIHGDLNKDPTIWLDGARQAAVGTKGNRPIYAMPSTKAKTSTIVSLLQAFWPKHL